MKIKAWISAFRLRTLPLSLSGIILGSFIAFKIGEWNSLIFIFSVLTTVLFQIVSNLANDLGDTLKGADNEGRVGPVRSVQSGEIKVGEMKNAVAIFSLFSLISAGILIYLASISLTFNLIVIYLILAVLCVIAALMYTIGRKAYGYNGLGDLFVFVFFGLVSVLGVYTLYTNNFDVLNFLPAIAIGFLSTAVLNLNNMRDQVNDQQVSKNTLVVKIGPEKAVRYHFFLILTSIILLGFFMYLKKDLIGLIGILPSLILIKHLQYVKGVKNDFVKFDTELKKVVLTTFLLSITCSVFLNI